MSHKHDRAASNAVGSFVTFCRAALDETEATALLLALAKSKGVNWSLPKQGLVWDAVSNFAQGHLSNEEVARDRRVF